MDFSVLMESLQDTLGDNLPAILGALAVLILGWFVALVVRAICRKGLGRIKLNANIQKATGQALDVEKWLSVALYYVILILALIGFLNVLDLGLVSGPLQDLVSQVFGFAPKLFAGAVLALVAWVLAMIVRTVVTRLLAKSTLDEKLSAAADVKPISETLGLVLYWWARSGSKACCSRPSRCSEKCSTSSPTPSPRWPSASWAGSSRGCSVI
jgi:hypothetical protein